MILMISTVSGSRTTMSSGKNTVYICHRYDPVYNKRRCDVGLLEKAVSVSRLDFGDVLK